MVHCRRGDMLGQSLSLQLSPRRPAQTPAPVTGSAGLGSGLSHSTHVSPSWGASRTHATQCCEGSRISRGWCWTRERNREPKMQHKSHAEKPRREQRKLTPFNERSLTAEKRA